MCQLRIGFGIRQKLPLVFRDEFTAVSVVGGVAQRLAAAQESNRGDEEAARGECQQDDGVAIGSLSGGRGSGGIVAALSAALGVGGFAERERCGEQEYGGEAAFHRGRYWKKASRTKRKSQRRPMACQYHPVQSTRIWRVSSCREA
jgi:hypothetical protein